jgi:hypothetical protein
MSTFDFVSHEAFPEDDYIAEAVVICIDNSHRVTYIRKKMKNGGMFWDVISVAVKSQSEKKYLKAYSQDSNFLAEDIKHFLDNRSWEVGRTKSLFAKSEPKGESVDQKNDEVPF